MSERIELIEKIHTAVLTDNLSDLKRLVSNVSPGWVSHDFTEAVGRDIIGYCGTTGAVNCARYLVDVYGLDVNGTGNQYPDGFNDEPAIHKAIAGNELEMVKFLASHPETNINTFYQEGSALECALNKRNYKAADIIIDAAPQIMDSMQWSGHARDYQMKAIKIACEIDDLEPIKYIVSKTENNEVFARGVGVALYYENDKVFSYLIENGVDVHEALCDYSSTPDSDQSRIDRNIKRLLSAGASFIHNDSYIAPILALENDSDNNMIGLFVKNGFDVNVNNGGFLNSLLGHHMVSELGHMLDYGADFELLDDRMMHNVVAEHRRDPEIYEIRKSPKNPYKLDALIAMRKSLSNGAVDEVDELVAAIRDDNAAKAIEVLSQNHPLWNNDEVDDLLMRKIGHHVIGWCLENDSKNCAKAIIENKLCNINAYADGSADIMPPLDTALSNHSNEIASLLLEQPGLYYNIPHSGVTALERALIDRNYEGAELLLEKRPVILNINADIFGPVYHQIKAAEISVYGDTRPVELIIEHTAGNRVLPSAGLAVLESRSVNREGIEKAIDKLFELGLDANELLVGVCGEANLKDYQDNIRHIKLCLDRGADFSFNEFSGPRLLASRSVSPEKFSALLDSGLDLNTNNGAILKKAASERDYSAFQTLIEAGCDPEMLDKPVRDYIPDFDSLDETSQNEVFFMEKLAAKASQSNENNSPVLNM